MNSLVFASLAIAVLVILLLFVFGIRVQRNNIWLIGYLVALAYSCWIGYLMDSREIYAIPHLIRTGTVFGYLIVPMLFLYVRSTCYPGVIWKPWYLLLFAPTVFFIIDMLPFWFSPVGNKIRVFEESMQNIGVLHRFSEGWLSPTGFHFLLRQAWSLGWFTAILVLIYRNRNLATDPTSANNRLVFRFMAGLSLLSLPFLVTHMILTFRDAYTLSNFTFLLALPLVMAGVYLMFFPGVVYGLRPERRETRASVPEENPGSPVHLPAYEIMESAEKKVPDITYEVYEQKLLAFMDLQKPYLNPGLTIHQLAVQSNIPTYILSMVLNRRFGRSFNTWLNKYRVEALKDLITRPDARSYTMESLGKSAGFGSRVTMINAFKKETGMTPGQFLRHQGRELWGEIT